MKHLLAAIALVALALPSQAAVLWNNGTYNSLGGNAMGDFLQGDDFVVSTTSDLTAFTFFSLEGSGEYRGSIYWSIYQDSAGTIGSQVAFGDVSPTRFNLGVALGLSIFQNDATFSVPGLATGTYWLVLHNGLITDTGFTDFYWAWADLDGTNTPTTRGMEQDLTVAPAWNDNGSEHAFSVSGDAVVTGVPEPSAIGLVTAGFAGLLLASRRRKLN